MRDLLRNGAFLGTFVAVLVSGATGNNDLLLEDWNPNWNYTNAGKDWTFLNCNNSKQVQSPVDLNTTGGGLDWWQLDRGVPFSFLPSYEAAVPDKKEVTNFTYTVSGDFGKIIVSEPSDYPATNVIKYHAKQIKFHYPSEHTVNGTEFDLEMQIYHEVRNHLLN